MTTLCVSSSSPSSGNYHFEHNTTVIHSIIYNIMNYQMNATITNSNNNNSKFDVSIILDSLDLDCLHSLTTILCFIRRDLLFKFKAESFQAHRARIHFSLKANGLEECSVLLYLIMQRLGPKPTKASGPVSFIRV